MFFQRIAQLLSAVSCMFICNIILAADSSFLAQSTEATVATTHMWLMTITLLVITGIVTLYLSRPKDFSDKEAFQAYYEKYRNRLI